MSIWLVLWAFLIGGFAGMLVFALTAMAGSEDDRAAKSEKAIKRKGLGRVELDKEWLDSDRWRAKLG